MQFRDSLLIALILATLTSATSADKPAVGLQQRTPWTTSRVIGSPEPPSPYIAQRVFAGLQFNRPAEMTAIPGTNRLVVVEVKGKIYSFEDRPLEKELPRDLFADVSGIHKDFYRAYGLAFHTKFEENRFCYVSYVLQPDTPGGSRVSRFTVTDTDPPRLNLDSEQILITWVSGGHNGAHLQFGPDGYLYITTGDGGQSFPPDGRNSGQDISDLMASILRIDVDHADAVTGTPYSIPRDNPFVDLPSARGEVWAYGLRNPWKMCFDPADGSLWVGDVGWEMWEMIYQIERGGNYGWSLVEGRQPVHRERKRGPTPILPPTVEHDHTVARSITGGYFYGADRLKELHGAYIYGDYVTGIVWALKHDQGKVNWQQQLVDTPLQIVTFGRDHHGEIYLVDYAGSIHRLAPNPRRGANDAFPRRLSETGLFASTENHTPAAGVLPFSINAPVWADGSIAERFVAIPGKAQLGVYQSTDVQIGYIAGEWKFPANSVLMKTVSMELEVGNPASRRRLETQLLHNDVDTWKAYNYIWNESQTDALLAPDEASTTTLTIRDKPDGTTRQQTWHHASRTECIICHTTRAGTVRGFKLQQLDRDHNYNGTVADQLATLDHIGLFANGLPAERAAWPNPHDKTADLSARARSYLHVNCAHCHRRGGGGTAAFDIRYELTLDKANLIGQRPTQGTFGIHAAQVVAPGDPYRSVLYYRMAKLGRGHMPHIGSQVIDRRGLKLIHDWIAQLDRSPEQVPASVRQSRSRQATLLRQLTAPESTPTPSASEEALQALLATPSGALGLARAVDEGRIPSGQVAAIIERGSQHADASIRGLFERYIPEDRRQKRLGSVIDANAILKLRGDAAVGKELFFTDSGVQCRNCHRLGEIGKELGPDLTHVGKRLSRDKLLESLLDPSRTIEPKFLTYLVETAAGRVHTGLLVWQTKEKVVLKDAAGKHIEIAADDVELLTPQQKSLMPELLLRELTAQQAADLIEFLYRQK